MPTPLTRNLTVNGHHRRVTVPDDTERLLYVLREQCDQRGPRFGCGVAQCGACTVLVNGEVTRSCVTDLNAVPEGAAIRTLDGIGSEARPHPLQRAFVTEQAGQCAFCVNAMIMGSLGWIESRIAEGNRAVPSRKEIADYLSGALPESTFNYLCRCGTHTRIVEAIHSGATEMVK
ncbi:(2Fe-2S)-binding protein [Rugosimonospora africana]|uniref:Oxidoreductase n=1 Tax=Rugosimonospora africana TaxID=556532 RepID=A0A8J3VS87_9ACTN|nr:2Fe-2S iron-sulfur cluster-binding protein [Rugosimonospora africana]GIH16316.1 oxidoreductase [Rugosimonospora africana]